MKTTEMWWNEVSNDPIKMVDWLKDQYHGEMTAFDRITNLLTQYPDISERDKGLITMIALDEHQHALWIRGLLQARGIEAKVLEKEERYWSKTLPTEPVSFQRMCAIGHHAEVMRLERITLLAGDQRFADIAAVFNQIRPDEVFHAKAFKMMSTPEDIEATRAAHQDGLNALGLVA